MGVSVYWPLSGISRAVGVGKKQLGWDWRQQGRVGLYKIWKKGVGNIRGVFKKKEGLGPSCQLYNIKGALSGLRQVLVSENPSKIIEILLFHLKNSFCSQNISTLILPNISKIKDNQTMKFCQFIEYNMRNLFLEKSFAKCGGKTIPVNKNCVYLWISSLEFHAICF